MAKKKIKPLNIEIEILIFLSFLTKFYRIENSKMSEKSENSKEKVEGSVATEKAATDANKEEEKVDLVSQ